MSLYWRVVVLCFLFELDKEALLVADPPHANSTTQENPLNIGATFDPILQFSNDFIFWSPKKVNFCQKDRLLAPTVWVSLSV